MRFLQMSQVDNLIPEHIKSSLSDAEVDSDHEINMDRVPFAKNTIRMDIKQIDRSLKAMSAQNKENVKQECADENHNRACTPSNDGEVQAQPLTPTANLKMLFNAMGPELKHRDEQISRDTSDEDVSPSNSQQEYQFETIIDSYNSGQPTSEMYEQIIDPNKLYNSNSRKEKSLGLLCQKFLHKYPEYPKPTDKIEICLDEVAKLLQVERRRIYDIVNVLESVEIVSRVAKNKYAWHGKSNLHTTLAKLKALGDSEGFGQQIQRLKDFEFNRELEEQLGKYDPNAKLTEPDFSIFGESSLFNQAALRKDKSLGIMSQKFLMLFLVSKPKTVNLDLSAKLLIGDANIDKTESAKFKTKIRRLYDIANILTSLGLIRKVHVTEIRGRKPAFQYVGPDIDTTEEMQTLGMECCSDGCHRPSSRHSMLDCIQNQNVAKIINDYKTTKPGAGDKDEKLKFARHSSFEQLCAIATVETTRLKASSEPPSPTKAEKCKVYTAEEIKKRIEEKKRTWDTQSFVELTDTSGTHFRIVDGESGPRNTHRLPTKGFVRKKMPASSTGKVTEVSTVKTDGTMTKVGSKGKGAEAIIIKTTGKPGGSNGKQPTVIPLTKEQIDAVLRSLKVPVPVSKEQVIDATTQSSPVENMQTVEIGHMKVEDLKEVNEKTPVVYVNTPVTNKRPIVHNDTIPMEKRIKLDFPSPSSDDQSPHSTNQENPVTRFKRKNSESKPSPQRALHLAPEFANTEVKQNMVPSGDAPKSGEQQSKKIEIIINESAQSSAQSLMKTVNLSGSAVQLGAQPTTILHLPVLTNLQGQPRVTIPVNMSPHTMVIKDTARPVQHVIQIPCTFSPTSNTVNNVAISNSTPQVYSYAISANQQANNIQFTNMQLVQPANPTRGGNTVTTLIRPIATKAASPNPATQIVAPKLLNSPNISPRTYLSKTPGGFIPISSSPSKITMSTLTRPIEVIPAQKLTDISALS